MRINNFEKELKEYCVHNSLDYSKVISSPMCGNQDVLMIQHKSKGTGEEGLNDSSPAEILLFVERKKDGTVQIEKRANADKYLKA